jgi:CheY-like chemotaxis protein
MIRDLKPDVITLDVEMPRMSGLEFLDRLMRARPTPVVMISSFTERGSEVTFRALELGAVEFVTKPRLNEETPDDYGRLIADKIRAASKARLRPPRRAASPTASRSTRGVPAGEWTSDGRRGGRLHGRHGGDPGIFVGMLRTVGIATSAHAGEFHHVAERPTGCARSRWRPSTTIPCWARVHRSRRQAPVVKRDEGQLLLGF